MLHLTITSSIQAAYARSSLTPAALPQDEETCLLVGLSHDRLLRGHVGLTQLDILAYNVYGRGRISGTVLLGAKPRQRSSFMRLSCYVMQRDILMASATVRDPMIKIYKY